MRGIELASFGVFSYGCIRPATGNPVPEPMGPPIQALFKYRGPLAWGGLFARQGGLTRKSARIFRQTSAIPAE
jgi:hypothetical protein